MAKVLILEDNPEIAVLYERIFEQHSTCIAPDIPDALNYLKSARPDLVIMDFHLPSGSGMAVLNFMRSNPGLKTVPVLGVSIDDMIKYPAVEQGLNAFLPKPIDLRELIETAQRLISANERPVPDQEMRVALTAYAEAYQKVYKRMPKGQWSGTNVLIDGQECDANWLRAETRRLNSLTKNGDPRNYLMRLLEKVRRL